MVTLAQRLEELRTRQGLTRPALASALVLPRNAIEKFETGRQTPTKEQQNKLAEYFNVSLAYLQGSSDDPTSMSNWMTAALSGAELEPDPAPIRRAAPAQKARAITDGSGQSGVLAALLSNKAFHDTLRAEILEVLRTSEGQALLADIVRKELSRQK